MKIIFITNFYPPASLGGYEQLCKELVDALRERRHEVIVLTSNYSRAELTKPDPEWVRRELHLEMELDSSRNAFLFFTRRKKYETENLRSLQQHISCFSPDMILIGGMWNMHRCLAALAERVMPGRILYYICDYWPTLPNQFENYWNAPPRNRITYVPKLVLKTLALKTLAREKKPDLKLEHVACCSNYLRNSLLQAEILHASARVLRNGINPQPFLNASKSGKNPANVQNNLLKLLYFGRLIHEKGVHTALQALGLLKQRGLAKNFELTILGSGNLSYEAKLHRMAVELGISDRVKFIPSVDRASIPNWLTCFDVYLFTSIWPEPMARSVMEAMAAGLLVIASEVGGQTEMLIHGENSLTFKPEDVEGLSDHIVRAFHDSQLRFRLAKAGQSMVLERFTLDRMINEMEELLQNIVEEAKGFSKNSLISCDDHQISLENSRPQQ